MLTDQQRQLILFLQAHPLATFPEIARKLEITPQTARRWFDQLHTGTPRVIINATAQIEPKLIGLENHTYFLSTNTIGADALHDLGMVHPYTTFQNRVFGHFNGILLQFYMPEGGSFLLDKLFERLSLHFPILDIIHFSHPPIELESFPHIEKWKNGRWEFDFSSWLNGETDFSRNENADPPSLLHRLSMTDVILIREMMTNARRKQVQIMKDVINNPLYSKEEKRLFAEDRQRTISRRMAFLKKSGIITGYRLLFDRNYFQIFNQVLFIGKMNLSTFHQIEGQFRNASLPFRSNLKYYPQTRDFLWWINLPPNQTSDCINFIYGHTTKMNMFLLDTIPDHSLSYPIYHRNFDEDAKKWNLSIEYAVHHPLGQVLGDTLKKEDYEP